MGGGVACKIRCECPNRMTCATPEKYQSMPQMYVDVQVRVTITESHHDSVVAAYTNDSRITPERGLNGQRIIRASLSLSLLYSLTVIVVVVARI